MKRNSLIILILICCSSCYLFECYDCIGPGQNASDWLCYSNNQVVVFQSELNETDSFYVDKWESLPPEKYCGREGSGSFGDCAGEGRSSLYRNKENRSSEAFFMIGYYYMGEDAVERSSVITFQFDAMRFQCNNKGVINETNHSNAAIKLLKYYTQNNKSYQNVYHCTENLVDSTIRVTEFYYHKTKGLLRYRTKDNGVIKTWTLQE